MLMMRLQRVGRKNDPSYRVVVVDKRTGPKSNKNIDILGSYNPKMNHVQLDNGKAKEWLEKGVQPSDTVHNLLVSEKVIEGKKINVLPKKSPIIDEAAQAEAAAAAEAAEPAEAAAEPVEDAETAGSDSEAAESAEEPEKAAEESPAEEAESKKAAVSEEAAESAANEKADEAAADEKKS